MTNDFQLPDEATKLIGTLKENLDNRELVFLIVGRVGFGKTSTVNALLGRKEKEPSKQQVGTKSVEQYQHEISGVKIRVCDTPGFGDDLPEMGKDDAYISMIKEEVPTPDCVIFISRMDENRPTGAEKNIFKLISQAFGTDIWKRSVIVHTFADKVDQEDYEETFRERTLYIRNEIGRYSASDEADKIPAIAISNPPKVSPEGKEWLGELLVIIFQRITHIGAIQLFQVTAPRILNGEIPLSAKLRKQLALALVNHMKEIGFVGGITMGSQVGLFIFGPVGAIAGGAIGGVGGIASGILANQLQQYLDVSKNDDKILD